MKKILIISYLFAPRAEIGAIRWTKIAKYLEKNHGIVSDVITHTLEGGYDELLAKDLEQVSGKIYRVAYSDPSFDINYKAKAASQEKPAASVSGIVNRFKRSSLVRSIRDLQKRRREHKGMWLDYEKGVDFSEQVVKFVHENGIHPEKYDAVVVSFGPVGNALAVLKLKELYPDMRLIMDFRDPMCSFMQPRRMRRMYAQIQDKLCQAAERVTVVSSDVTNDAGFRNYSEKTVTVYNGFDPVDLAGCDENTSDDSYSFCYTGSLYDGVRDLSPLFSILSELVENGIVNKSRLCFDYAGTNFSVLTVQAQRYGMGDILKDHGVLSRSECLYIQKNSRCLTLCAWNKATALGNLPGKFLEYMMIGKPILTFVTGDVPNSEIRGMIEKARLGAAYEEADRDATRKTMYDFLRADYQRFEQGLGWADDSDSSVVERFDYRNIAAQVAQLISGDSETEG